ncbi:MAG: alkyl hydroperoxide reductase [Bacteroidetes bacterium]|nr:MAG: alkyl hydroperoxide reductase [Bacteroidota bacterium]
MRTFKIITIASFLICFSAGITAKENIIRPAVGDLAPEIAMKNPTGEIIKLSSLRGKVVLIDFWASWCRPCRIENNTVRKVYNQYKNSTFDIGEGFTVFSVSLDEEADIWKKAIHNDRLSWENHVCDFKKWDSPIIEVYNFTYLPHNLLIDKDGRIVAKGLFGSKLEQELAKHLAE